MRACAPSTWARKQPMLELKHLDSGYGRAQVLFGLDLKLGPGEVLALLGRNGAGKSTALKTIMGVLASCPFMG